MVERPVQIIRTTKGRMIVEALFFVLKGLRRGMVMVMVMRMLGRSEDLSVNDDHGCGYRGT